MATVVEHVTMLDTLRKLWRHEYQREPEHRDLMLNFDFKLEAARLCAVHLNELIEIVRQHEVATSGVGTAAEAGQEEPKG